VNVDKSDIARVRRSLKVSKPYVGAPPTGAIGVQSSACVIGLSFPVVHGFAQSWPPPSTVSVSPVSNPPEGPARWTQACAISHGKPARIIQPWVSIAPGGTQLTRMFSGAH